MQPNLSPLKRTLFLVLAVLLLLFLVVKCLNTPHQDSSERPMSDKDAAALQRGMERESKRADSLQVVADSSAARSRAAYALGVDAGQQAAALRLETHQKPKPHAQAPATPAAVKQLQQYFDEF